MGEEGKDVERILQVGLALGLGEGKLGVQVKVGMRVGEVCQERTEPGYLEE